MSHAQLALKTGQAKLWILLVGVSQYQDQRFPILQYSTVDTQRLADAFTEVIQEFPNTTLKLHHDNALPPTLSEVRSSLQEIVEHAKPDDTVLFYFSGHGALDSRMQQVVFCMADTQKDAMLQTGLSVISLLGSLGNCAAKQQILWVDACHANGMTLQTDTPEILDNPTWQLSEMFRQRAAQNPGFQALLSCEHKQQSWKFPELGHSIFSHFLIEGLRGGAANPQGVVIASVLGNYVHDRMIQYIDRTNQQLEWLHRDGENRSSKAIVQKPVRIGNAQLHLPIGIRPKDPLEYLFPEIKAPDIEPPLARSASRRKPTLEAKNLVPPPIEKPTTIEPTIPPLQKIVPEAPAPEPIPEIISIEPVLPKAQEPVSEFVEPPVLDVNPPVPLIEAPQAEEIQVEEIQAEEIQVEPTLSIEIEPPQPEIPESISLQETQPEAKVSAAPEPSSDLSPIETPVADPPVFFTPSPIEEPPLEVVEPIATDLNVSEVSPEWIDPTPLTQEPSLPNEIDPWHEADDITESISLRSNPVEPQHALPKVADSIAPVKPPRTRQDTQRQIQRFQHVTKERWNSAAIALNGAVRKTTQSVGNFATSQQAQAKQQASLLRNSLSKKLGSLSQATRQAANSGQTLYRQSVAEANHIATDAVQNLDRSTRNLHQTANTAWSKAAERTQAPETRQLATTALKTLGVVTLSMAGVGAYLYRNDQIHQVQTLSSTATTQMQSNQNSQALATALKAGQILQRVDRPWNFVPESLKLSTIATLQQAVSLADNTSPPIGAGFANATLSPDQKAFAISTPKNTIQIWRQNDAQLQQRETELSGHKAAIAKLIFSPDGKRLASASADKTIKIWDVEKGILIQTLAAHTQAVTALSFRSDGEVLASGSADQTIKLWGVSNGRILDTFKGHNAVASVIRFSPDGRILAAGTKTNTIHLWYPDSQNPVLLGSHDRTAVGQGINDLAFTPDGKTIASAGADKTIRLWNVGSATTEREAIPTQTLTGHEEEVTSLSFTASGQILASGGRDLTIRLWNMRDGTFLKTLLGAKDPIEQLSFTANDQSLSSVGNQYGLKIWSLDLNSLMETGCQLAGSQTMGCS
jgi:uncharacterized caspase-like protein